jgi:hypothetical protein
MVMRPRPHGLYRTYEVEPDAGDDVMQRFGPEPLLSQQLMDPNPSIRIAPRPPSDVGRAHSNQAQGRCVPP